MNLQKLMEHFFKLYGKRNRIFLQNLLQRIVFLNLAIADLQEAIRKQADPADLKIALARIVSRIFCVADYFASDQLAVVMSQKYPNSHCSYCQKLPCKCPEKRPSSILTNPNPTQLNWTLKQWCRHFKKIYGAKNKSKGLENILNRLFKEISELLILAMKTPSTFSAHTTIDDIEIEFSKELADTLAWTIAIANLLTVDLEQAVLERYGNGCWKCHNTTCTCTEFNYDQVFWPSVK
ncbi:hypothetical protein KKC17_03735 [Patescibacteria group bacterium]|nr:hypothetical protein [Patescibacteria group bacterium]